MKIRFLNLALFCVAFFFVVGIRAQERIIHGVVTTFDSIPLSGATIKVQSTKQITVSDSIGNFSIGCGLTDKLKVTAQGFSNQTVKLLNTTKFAAVNLSLKPGEKNREYAIGYTRISDRDKLNALVSKSNKDIDFSIYSNVFDAISGRFPGVQIVGGEIIIRGNNTINGTSPALIVIDGIPTNHSALNSMNPEVIKSINIIKDGSSAIYGSSGANGVVEIVTKRGGDE